MAARAHGSKGASPLSGLAPQVPSYRVVPPSWSSPVPNAGQWWDIVPPDVRLAGKTLQG
jgi:hypothetical protein